MGHIQSLSILFNPAVPASLFFAENIALDQLPFDFTCKKCVMLHNSSFHFVKLQTEAETFYDSVPHSLFKVLRL